MSEQQFYETVQRQEEYEMEELHNSITSVLNYDKNSGEFTWIKTKSRAARVGDKAGSIDKDGYLIIKVDGKSYRAQRLAWFYVYKCFPKLSIDHINNNKLDNSIANLREATQSQQNHNRPVLKRNMLGVKGVRKHGNKYQALICKDGKQVILGAFKTIKDASIAYTTASKTIYGEYSHGNI